MGFADGNKQQPYGPHHLTISKRANQPKIQAEKGSSPLEQEWLGLWFRSRASHPFTIHGSLLTLRSSLRLSLGSVAPASMSLSTYVELYRLTPEIEVVLFQDFSSILFLTG